MSTPSAQLFSTASADGRRLRVWLAALAGVLLAACASAPPPASGPASGPALGEAPRLAARPSTQQPASEARTGITRLTDGTSAELYVPRTYRPDQPAPFLLLLHGATGRGADMIDHFRHDADVRGVILLAPDSEGTTWDVVQSFVRGRSTGAPTRYGADVPRIDAALTAVFSRYAIDPARTGVLGVSDGAGYALALGTNNPALFPRVIALSPGFIMPVEATQRARIFIAHGRQDRILPVDVTTTTIVPALRAAGFDVTLDLFNGGHNWPRPVTDAAMSWFLTP
ncbi:MAG: phospholipase [Alphaproteobacteria bacterium]|nr:phospholipase [Alphaproteobacteria bacterium]